MDESPEQERPVLRSKHGETRRVPMNDTVRELLRALPRRLESEWVFPSGTGETPLDGQKFVTACW